MKIYQFLKMNFKTLTILRKVFNLNSVRQTRKLCHHQTRKKRRKNKGEKIYCPQMPTGAVPAQWISTFVIAECGVCFETKKMKISSVCGHGICNECYIKIKDLK